MTGSHVSRDDMIYEYIGDVISQPSFIKRMREYAEEGIRHFYFMMLQKDEVRSVFQRKTLTMLIHIHRMFPS